MLVQVAQNRTELEEKQGEKVMRYICYERVSSDEQSLSGAGLGAQEDQCRGFAQRGGGEFVGPFVDDAVSGGTGLDRRPQLMAAISTLKRGDVLLVAKRDRLCRGDVILTAMIEAAVRRKGARVVSAAGEGTLDDDPASILMRRLIDSFGEYEKLLIGARTRAALQAKIRRGQRCGSIRFGYDLAADRKSLVENPNEQAVLATIQQERARGRSPRKIAELLTDRGVATKTGNITWTHTAIRRILARAI
jgi:DNA invertase Pin-like site-specific DNA recombinase